MASQIWWWGDDGQMNTSGVDKLKYDKLISHEDTQVEYEVFCLQFTVHKVNDRRVNVRVGRGVKIPYNRCQYDLCFKVFVLYKMVDV